MDEDLGYESRFLILTTFTNPYSAIYTYTLTRSIPVT